MKKNLYIRGQIIKIEMGDNVQQLKEMSSGSRNKWTREELILTLSVYFQLTFGRLNRNTPEVKELAKLIGRTDNSAALRLVNFAACDPYIIESGRTGMSAGKRVCMPIWQEYAFDKERLFQEAAEIKAKFQNQTLEQSLSLIPTDFVGHERESVIRQRVDQNVFRNMILNNYNNRCAITGINDERLLIASHIIPWAVNRETRLNPENGICLSPMYDRAFDKGLISIMPDDFTVTISPSLKSTLAKQKYDDYFGIVEHKKILLPEEHIPNVDFLKYHLENIFIA